MRYSLLTLLVSLLSLPSLAQDSLNMSVLYHWNDTTLPSSAFHDNRYNEIWGVVVDNREYAIIGSTDGTHIFDVTDPINSTEVEFIPGKEQGPVIVHRDYHDYNGYLYMVADEGNSSLQILDLTHLPDSAPVVYDDGALIVRAHNIFIDENQGIMYQCGGNAGRQLALYSLADPENPTLLLDCGTDLSFWNGTVGYVHDVFVENGIAYCNAETRGLFVVDFNDLTNPTILGSLEIYPEQGYNHSGWLAQNGTIYVMADETHGRDLKLVDVSDPTDITITSLFNSQVDSLSIPHNVIIEGDYLYASYYHDGVYIFDIRDPTQPLIVGYYDTSTELHGFNYRGAWGIYPFLPSGNLLASDMQNGLYVFDISMAVVGVDENVGSSMLSRVYPNPFRNRVIIQTPDVNNSQVDYRLMDATGRLMSQGRLNGSLNSVNFEEDLPNGVYFLEINTENYREVHKLIKAI